MNKARNFTPRLGDVLRLTAALAAELLGESQLVYLAPPFPNSAARAWRIDRTPGRNNLRAGVLITISGSHIITYI